MANTGNQTVLTLEQYDLTTNLATGLTKPNTPGDPNYIAPNPNPVACPIATDLVCPVIKAAQKGADIILYEFSLALSVLANASFDHMNIILKNELGAVIQTQTPNYKDPDFFTGRFVGLTTGHTYTISIQYLDIANTVLQTCAALASVTLGSTITWAPIDPSCQTQNNCATGWHLDESGTTCIQETDATPTPPSGGVGTGGTIVAVSDEQWNDGGAIIYQPGYPSSGDGTVNVRLLAPHLWVNGNFQWDSVGRNTVDSRMNVAGIWSHVDGTPIGEWVGFSRKFVNPVAKTLYVGMSADNQFKFSLNGTVLVENTGILQGGSNFNYWNIYPVALPAGTNYIEMEAKNVGGPGGMAAEIYDATIAQLQACVTTADLNAYILFSTKDMVGDPFDLGTTVGYSCPGGYVLDSSDPDPTNWVCRLISVAVPTVVNTGMKVWQNRQRLVDGVADGFTEANALGSGTGTYFPPVEDEALCTIPPGGTPICVTAINTAGSIVFHSLNSGVAFNVPNAIVIAWIYQVNGGSWTIAPDQTILSGAADSTAYLIPGLVGGETIDILITAITPDQDGVYNYSQC